MSFPSPTEIDNATLLVELLKAHHIKRILLPPNPNQLAVADLFLSDSFFDTHITPDERSMAYQATGWSEAASGAPVVICCGDGTAERNLMPGLTEAYYRKHPILVIAEHRGQELTHDLTTGILDLSEMPNDTFRCQTELRPILHADDAAAAAAAVNRAVIALTLRGGGPSHLILFKQQRPCHLDAPWTPRAVHPVSEGTELPALPPGRIAVAVGYHGRPATEETQALEAFCETCGAIVVYDHMSRYRGKHGILATQMPGGTEVDLLIHMGENMGAEMLRALAPKQVWRLSPDGAWHDSFRCLTRLFHMPEKSFLSRYAALGREEILPWDLDTLPATPPAAESTPLQDLARMVSEAVHLPLEIHTEYGAILDAWNQVSFPPLTTFSANVGTGGREGALSALLGASLANPDRLHLGVLSSTSVISELNTLGNRHWGSNVNILIIRESDNAVLPGQRKLSADTLLTHFAEALGMRCARAESVEGLRAHLDDLLSLRPGASPLLITVSLA